MVKYEISTRVRYYETDAMGIVHHSDYIRYFENARTEFMRNRGYPYDEMEKAGILMPVLSITAEYKVPAVYDEEITVSCWISKLKGASIEMGYEIRGEDKSRVYVTGTSRHGFTSKDLKPLPLKKAAPHIYAVFKDAME